MVQILLPSWWTDLTFINGFHPQFIAFHCKTNFVPSLNSSLLLTMNAGLGKVLFVELFTNNRACTNLFKSWSSV